MKTKHLLIVCVLSFLCIACGSLDRVPSSYDSSNDLGYGFGKRNKDENNYSISKVKTELNETVVYDNIYEYLAGRVPGLSISSGNVISIRDGITSPLILIDGIEGPLDLVRPEDVESVTVLKDASAVSYGVKAAGGVILIETKK